LQLEKNEACWSRACPDHPLTIESVDMINQVFVALQESEDLVWVSTAAVFIRIHSMALVEEDIVS
jgi:hypothetical protein